MILDTLIYLTPAHWFSVVAPFLWFIPTTSCNDIPPSPGDNHQSYSSFGWSKRKQGQAKMATWNSFSPGLSTFSYLSCIIAQPPPSFLCYPSLPSHHWSSLTSVYLIPALFLLLPSTLFWPYGTHSFFPHA